VPAVPRIGGGPVQIPGEVDRLGAGQDQAGAIADGEVHQLGAADVLDADDLVNEVEVLEVLIGDGHFRTPAGRDGRP
jgi:hypothetical protein